jgi:Arylsulfotransferase (ASST)
MNKKVPFWVVLLLLWFAVIAIITYGWAVWYIDKTLAKGKTANAIILIASSPSLVRESFNELFNPRMLIRPDVYPGINGFKMEKSFVDSNYILLPTFDKKADQSIIKLIRLSDRKLIYQWVPDFDKILQQTGDKRNKHNILAGHPLLAADGTIIFDASPLLIKINKDSKLVWAINKDFHHSNEYDADGNIWAPSVIKPSKFLSYMLVGFKDDALTKISPDGKVLLQKSIAEILVQNGYRTLLLGTGVYEEDLVHLNDIQPALTSTQYWLKGDLLISIKHKSTVFLYRPSTNKIIWLQTGPWLNQHDVDFIDNTRIGIFGNNIVRTNLAEQLLDGYNEEYVFDFKSQKMSTPYTQFLKNAKVSTKSEGRSDILPNGDLFIEETDNNRLLMGNTKNVLWQFVNRIDKHSVAALEWTRFISKDEFKTLKFLSNN